MRGAVFVGAYSVPPARPTASHARNTFPLYVQQHGITAYQFLFTWYQAIPREQKTKRHLQYLYDLYIHKTSRFRDARYISFGLQNNQNQYLLVDIYPNNDKMGISKKPREKAQLFKVSGGTLLKR